MVRALELFRKSAVSVAACLVAVSVGAAGVAAGPPEIPEEVSCPADEAAMKRVQEAMRSPFGASAKVLAREALDLKARPREDHPYLARKAEVRKRLDLLGLFRASGDHVHISDVDLEHGGAVLRAALGLNPLVKTVSSTMSVGGVTEAFAEKHLSKEQFARFRVIYESQEGAPPVESMEALLSSGMVELESQVLEKRLRVQQLMEHRHELPSAKRIFVNMSFGQSPDRVATMLASEIMMAPPGSALHALATKTLGEPPVVLPDDLAYEPPPPSRCDEAPLPEAPPPEAPGAGDDEMPPELKKIQAQHLALKRRLVYPRLTALMRDPAMAARMNRARAELGAVVEKAKEVGILVFEAAGNEHQDATEAGNPDLSRSGSEGAKGLLRIGALDPKKLGDPKDDRMAVFSAAGRIALATQGVKLPVWFEMGEITDSEGTSFASPVALEVGVAVAAAAKNRDITASGVASLLTDPRAVHDISGTTRDGAGALDDFAAILLAANPSLSRATIDEAWKLLGAPNPDVGAVKRMLGLS